MADSGSFEVGISSQPLVISLSVDSDEFILKSGISAVHSSIAKTVLEFQKTDAASSDKMDEKC